jgi:hypothetical protein
MFTLYWKPFSTVPKQGERFHVYAKRWVSTDDKFLFETFYNCYYHRDPPLGLSGVPAGWHPTHWVEPLPPPEWTPAGRPPLKVWIKADRNWAKAAGNYETLTTDIHTLERPNNPAEWIEFIETKERENS